MEDFESRKSYRLADGPWRLTSLFDQSFRVGCLIVYSATRRDPPFFDRSSQESDNFSSRRWPAETCYLALTTPPNPLWRLKATHYISVVDISRCYHSLFIIFYRIFSLTAVTWRGRWPSCFCREGNAETSLVSLVFAFSHREIYRSWFNEQLLRNCDGNVEHKNEIKMLILSFENIQKIRKNVDFEFQNIQKMRKYCWFFFFSKSELFNTLNRIAFYMNTVF